MAVKGNSFAEHEEYICKDDPARTKEDGATVFYLGNIPSFIQAELKDMQSSATVNFGDAATQTMNNRVSARNRKAFRIGIKGWHNFPDTKGAMIPYEVEPIFEGGRQIMAVAEAIMDRIPLGVWNEVGQEVFNVNTMTEADRKKFEGLSSLFAGSQNSAVEIVDQKIASTEDATAQPVKGTTGSTPSTKTPRKRTKKTELLGSTGVPGVLS